jgi:hypothetical protein
LDDQIRGGSLGRWALTLKQFIQEYQNLDYDLWIDPDDPIRIVHLSDLQFGGFDRWKLSLDAQHCWTTICEQWPNGPHFIAITGDITERGLPSEFQAAHAWTAKLAAACGWRLPSNRIVLVPGNHDVCLSLAASALLALKEESGSKKVDFVSPDSRYEDLEQFAFAPFLEFAAKTAAAQYLPPLSDGEKEREARFSLSWIEPRFRHEGIVFVGFNSARPLADRLFPQRFVSGAAIEQLADTAVEACADQPTKPLVVGLSHHSPTGDRNDRSVQNPDALSKLFVDIRRLGLWLHGHWHEPRVSYIAEEGRKLVISRAPTMTLAKDRRPEDAPRGFALVELSRKNRSITGCHILPVRWRSGRLWIDEGSADHFSVNASGQFVPADVRGEPPPA